MNTRPRRFVVPAFGIILGTAIAMQGCAGAPLMHRGGIQVNRWAEVKADDNTVAEILAAFNRAEEALQAKNLDGLMDLYAQNYSYHGLSRSDLKRIWGELFAGYHGFKSNHIFSRIEAGSGKPPGSAEVTCTGSLWAISNESGQPVNLDSWYGEVHHLVYENNAWRVRGHAGEAPKGIQFGVAPHPFF